MNSKTIPTASFRQLPTSVALMVGLLYWFKGPEVTYITLVQITRIIPDGRPQHGLIQPLVSICK